MIPDLRRLLPRVAKSRDERLCAACHAPLNGEPSVRVHGAQVHRYCLGYRARQALRP